jgi:hypothetical protein
MIRDLALLVLARSLLRVCPPLRAHSILLRIGKLFPELRSPEEARTVARSLSAYGSSCLARSLAVAARAPTAEVAIGVVPRNASPLFAHAWVEMDGAPIDPADTAGGVIARLSGPRARELRTPPR